MTVPFGVGDCLYTGISRNIDHLKTTIDQNETDYYKDKYNRLEDALEWYKDNCVVSYTYLKEDFDILTKLISKYNNRKSV